MLCETIKLDLILLLYFRYNLMNLFERIKKFRSLKSKTIETFSQN